MNLLHYSLTVKGNKESDLVTFNTGFSPPVTWNHHLNLLVRGNDTHYHRDNPMLY